MLLGSLENSKRPLSVRLYTSTENDLLKPLTLHIKPLSPKTPNGKDQAHREPHRQGRADRESKGELRSSLGVELLAWGLWFEGSGEQLLFVLLRL